MGNEKLNTPEVQTMIFFDRPADMVVSEFAAEVVEQDNNLSKGQAKMLQVGDKNYRIVRAEAYLEQEAIQVWKGKRAEQIRGLKPGEAITYRSRSGELTFVKTRGADNILIRGLEDMETGQKIKNATEVTKVFGLSHGEEGRLVISGENQLKFEKI